MDMNELFSEIQEEDPIIRFVVEYVHLRTRVHRYARDRVKLLIAARKVVAWAISQNHEDKIADLQAVIEEVEE